MKARNRTWDFSDVWDASPNLYEKDPWAVMESEVEATVECKHLLDLLEQTIPPCWRIIIGVSWGYVYTTRPFNYHLTPTYSSTALSEIPARLLSLFTKNCIISIASSVFLIIPSSFLPRYWTTCQIQKYSKLELQLFSAIAKLLAPISMTSLFAF